MKEITFLAKKPNEKPKQSLDGFFEALLDTEQLEYFLKEFHRQLFGKN